MGTLGARSGRGAVLCAALCLFSVATHAGDKPCGKADFEAVVEEASGSLRDLNSENKPTFQDKLRELKDKRGWTHDQFMREAAPFVRDDKIAEFDHRTEELLGAIAAMGQEGAAAKTPDCALLLELRARMTLLVETQTSKWAYMFEKIEGALGQ
ncbi:MAG: hypothetical protein ABL907_08805 [Hyphomicrobium sp.]